MTRLEIIRMAHEAGFMAANHPMNPWSAHTDQIEAFAALVAAAKQEEIESTLLRLHEQAASRHNYFQHAVQVIRGEA